MKSETGKHCKFATILSSSLVLLGSAPKTFYSSLPYSFSFEISWQKTIWVDVTIPLLKNPGGKYSPKVIGVMNFCTKKSSTCTIACFLLGFFSSFFFRYRLIFFLCCSFGYGWDSCFLWGLLHVTNVQLSSLYDIDS